MKRIVRFHGLPVPRKVCVVNDKIIKLADEFSVVGGTGSRFRRACGLFGIFCPQSVFHHGAFGNISVRVCASCNNIIANDFKQRTRVYCCVFQIAFLLRRLLSFVPLHHKAGGHRRGKSSLSSEHAVGFGGIERSAMNRRAFRRGAQHEAIVCRTAILPCLESRCNIPLVVPYLRRNSLSHLGSRHGGRFAPDDVRGRPCRIQLIKLELILSVGAIGILVVLEGSLCDLGVLRDLREINCKSIKNSRHIQRCTRHSDIGRRHVSCYGIGCSLQRLLASAGPCRCCRNACCRHCHTRINDNGIGAGCFCKPLTVRRHGYRISFLRFLKRKLHGTGFPGGIIHDRSCNHSAKFHGILIVKINRIFLKFRNEVVADGKGISKLIALHLLLENNFLFNAKRRDSVLNINSLKHIAVANGIVFYNRARVIALHRKKAHHIRAVFERNAIFFIELFRYGHLNTVGFVDVDFRAVILLRGKHGTSTLDRLLLRNQSVVNFFPDAVVKITDRY